MFLTLISILRHFLFLLGFVSAADRLDPLVHHTEPINSAESEHEGHGSNGWGSD